MYPTGGWHKAVAQGKPGVTAGTISGTGLDVVYVRLLQLGDPGGHVTRALTAFDYKIWMQHWTEDHKSLFH